MLTSSPYRFYWVNFGIPLACAAAVFLMFDMTKIDIAFSNLLFDPVTQGFPLDKVHFFEQLTHKWARIIPNWTAEIALIGAILSFVWPLINTQRHPRLGGLLERSYVAPVLRFANGHRRDFLFVVFAFAICTGVIHFLKRTPACTARLKRPCMAENSPTWSGTTTSSYSRKPATDAAGRADMPRAASPCSRCISWPVVTAGASRKR